MATQFSSKHGVVRRSPAEIFMGFTDMRNFLMAVPADKKEGISATYDTITANVQGVNIGAKIVERVPYNKIVIKDDGAPFAFTATFHFDEVKEGTDFSIDIDADLNFMMKMMLGNKLKEALDQVVDGIVNSSKA